MPVVPTKLGFGFLASSDIIVVESLGIQYLIIDLDPSKELEALEMFADEIIKKS
jgi:hypothetical protein